MGAYIRPQRLGSEAVGGHWYSLSPQARRLVNGLSFKYQDSSSSGSDHVYAPKHARPTTAAPAISVQPVSVNGARMKTSAVIPPATLLNTWTSSLKGFMLPAERSPHRPNMVRFP